LADGGLTMRKPYISGDGYIMKMSNYKKLSGKNRLEANNGLTWNEKWNAVFHNFIDRNGVKLSKTYYAGLVKAWNKKPLDERKQEMQIAKDIITTITGS